MVSHTNVLQRYVADFHREFGLPAPETPQPLSMQDFLLRRKLMREELAEWEGAVANEVGTDILTVKAYKELCDLLYVVLGTAVSMGFDVEPFFAEVHRSNMSKRWEDGEVHKDEDGKILKPPTYSPADMDSVMYDRYIQHNVVNNLVRERSPLETIYYYEER